MRVRSGSRVKDEGGKATNFGGSGRTGKREKDMSVKTQTC